MKKLLLLLFCIVSLSTKATISESLLLADILSTNLNSLSMLAKEFEQTKKIAKQFSDYNEAVSNTRRKVIIANYLRNRVMRVPYDIKDIQKIDDLTNFVRSSKYLSQQMGEELSELEQMLFDLDEQKEMMGDTTPDPSKVDAVKESLNAENLNRMATIAARKRAEQKYKDIKEFQETLRHRCASASAYRNNSLYCTKKCLSSLSQAQADINCTKSLDITKTSNSPARLGEVLTMGDEFKFRLEKKFENTKQIIQQYLPEIISLTLSISAIICLFAGVGIEHIFRRLLLSVLILLICGPVIEGASKLGILLSEEFIKNDGQELLMKWGSVSSYLDKKYNQGLPEQVFSNSETYKQHKDKYICKRISGKQGLDTNILTCSLKEDMSNDLLTKALWVLVRLVLLAISIIYTIAVYTSKYFIAIFALISVIPTTKDPLNELVSLSLWVFMTPIVISFCIKVFSIFSEAGFNGNILYQVIFVGLISLFMLKSMRFARSLVNGSGLSNSFSEIGDTLGLGLAMGAINNGISFATEGVKGVVNKGFNAAKDTIGMSVGTFVEAGRFNKMKEKFNPLVSGLNLSEMASVRNSTDLQRMYKNNNDLTGLKKIKQLDSSNSLALDDVIKSSNQRANDLLQSGQDPMRNFLSSDSETPASTYNEVISPRNKEFHLEGNSKVADKLSPVNLNSSSTKIEAEFSKVFDVNPKDYQDIKLSDTELREINRERLPTIAENHYKEKRYVSEMDKKIDLRKRIKAYRGDS